MPVCARRTSRVLIVLVAASAATAGARQPAAVRYECWEQNPSRHVEATAGLRLCSGRQVASPESDSDLAPDDGSLIVALEPESAAAVGGLRVGDLIYKVDGVRVTDARSAAAGLEGLNAARDTLINFLRDGRPYLVRLRQR